MDIIITADSTCDLPDYLVQENDIVILPLSIFLLGENSYLDGIEIHPKDIYEHVAKPASFPKQQPLLLSNIQMFCQANNR